MKSKRIITILLSLAIMLTFMPAMAFASTSTDGVQPDNAKAAWVADHTSVTVTFADKTSKNYSNVTRSWNWNDNDSIGKGKVHAWIDWRNTAGVAQTANAAESYYDFNYATIVTAGTWGRTAFDKAWEYAADGKTMVLKSGNAGIALAKPSYITDANTYGNKPATGVVEFNPNASDKLETVFYVSGFDPKSYEAQDVTITASIAPTGTGSQTATDYTPFIGNVQEAKITVLAKDPDVKDVQFGIDKVKNGVGDRDYDGKTHKIVNSTVPGVSVEYYVQDAKTKVYNKVLAFEFKDAGTYHAKAVVTNDTTKETINRFFDFTVDAADEAYVMFDGAEYDIREGVEYDPYDFLEAYGGDGAAKYDKAEILAYFKELYEITETVDKYDELTSHLKIVAKDLSDSEKEAIYKKYATLLANYDDVYGDITDTADVVIILDMRDFEIEFKNTPTTKTYKAKVLKKKAKSFKAKAVSTSGEAVSYKLINAPAKIVINKTSGKITCKKGLAKGTYKIKVKAYLPKTKHHDYVSETQTITIKVKAK